MNRFLTDSEKLQAWIATPWGQSYRETLSLKHNLELLGNELKFMLEDYYITRILGETYRIGLKCKAEFDRVKGEHTGDPRFWITVRPNTKICSFARFYEFVHKCVNRKCFEDYILTFEQKWGDQDADPDIIKKLGDGFHIHIIAKMMQKTKAAVLRDIQSSFKKCTAPQCVQVDIIFDPEQVNNLENYITNYTSKDGHKIKTKETDSLWRTQEGLLSVYNGCLPNKPGRQTKSPIKSHNLLDFS